MTAKKKTSKKSARTAQHKPGPLDTARAAALAKLKVTPASAPKTGG